MIDLINQEVPQDDSTSADEKDILCAEIRKRKPKVLVEIGTHRGLTTLYMANTMEEIGVGHIHTYDPNEEWGQRGNFRKFPELEKRISFYPVQGKDSDVKDIDFLFIDGFHEKHYVVEEIKALFPCLTEGAVVFFHDTNGSNPSCDVPGAIDECGLKVEYLTTLNGMAKYENISNQPKPKTPRARVRKGKPTKSKS